MAETIEDVVMRIMLDFQQTRVPALDTSVAERSLQTFEQRVSAAQSRAASSISDPTRLRRGQNQSLRQFQGALERFSETQSQAAARTAATETRVRSLANSLTPLQQAIRNTEAAQARSNRTLSQASILTREMGQTARQSSQTIVLSQERVNQALGLTARRVTTVEDRMRAGRGAATAFAVGMNVAWVAGSRFQGQMSQTARTLFDVALATSNVAFLATQFSTTFTAGLGRIVGPLARVGSLLFSTPVLLGAAGAAAITYATNFRAVNDTISTYVRESRRAKELEEERVRVLLRLEEQQRRQEATARIEVELLREQIQLRNRVAEQRRDRALGRFGIARESAALTPDLRSRLEQQRGVQRELDTRIDNLSRQLGQAARNVGIFANPTTRGDAEQFAAASRTAARTSRDLADLERERSRVTSDIVRTERTIAETRQRLAQQLARAERQDEAERRRFERLPASQRLRQQRTGPTTAQTERAVRVQQATEQLERLGVAESAIAQPQQLADDAARQLEETIREGAARQQQSLELVANATAQEQEFNAGFEEFVNVIRASRQNELELLQLTTNELSRHDAEISELKEALQRPSGRYGAVALP